MNKSKVTINSLSGTLLYIINVVVAFIISPVMVMTLGNKDYGIWELIVGIVGYMGILDLGIGPALLRYVAVEHGKGNKKELQETIGTSMLFFICIGVIVAILFAFLSFYPEILLGNETSKNFRLVLLLFSANAMLSFPLRVFVGVLMGLQYHFFINITRAVFTVLRAVLTYFLLYHFMGNGLLVLVSLEISSSILQLFVYIVFIFRDKTVPKFSLYSFTAKKMKTLVYYGLKSALFLIASRIQVLSVPFIIGKTIGLGGIVFYALPNRLVDYAKGFSMAIGFPLTPYFADMISKDKGKALKDGWLTSSFVLQIVTLSMPIFLFFCGERFIELWIGNEYAVKGRWILYILLIGLFAESFSPNARQMLMAKNEHGRIAIIWVGMAILSLPIAILGIKTFGISGSAIGISVVTTFVSLLTFYSTCSVMLTPISEYFVRTISPLIVPLLLLCLSLWACGYAIAPENYFELLLQMIFGLSIYLVSLWFLSIPEKVKKKIINIFLEIFKLK